MKPSPQKSVMS